MSPSVSLSPLHLAAHSGLKQAVQELLSRGASIQTVDENGRVTARWLPHISWVHFNVSMVVHLVQAMSV